MADVIGRVLAATAQSYRAGCQVLEAVAPVLGAFIEAPILGGRGAAISIIAGIESEGDLLIEQVAVSLQAPARAGEDAVDLEAYIADQRQRPNSAPSFEVLLLGYRDEAGRVRPGLPPQPAQALAPVALMTAGAIACFAAQPDYLARVALGAPLEVPRDQLLIAVVLQAFLAVPAEERRKVVLGYGRFCARLFGRDLIQLEWVLAGLRGAYAG